MGSTQGVGSDSVKTLPYAVFFDECVVRVKHFGLDKPYWNRSREDRPAREVETALLTSLDQRKLHRSHNDWHGYVDFKLRKEVFASAVVILRMTYEPDRAWEDALLHRYPAPGEYGPKSHRLRRR